MILSAISTRGQPTRYSIAMLTVVPGCPSSGDICITRGAHAVPKQSNIAIPRILKACVISIARKLPAGNPNLHNRLSFPSNANAVHRLLSGNQPWETRKDCQKLPFADHIARVPSP